MVLAYTPYTAEADSDPTFQLGDKFMGIQSMDARIAGEKTKTGEAGPNVESKFGQAGEGLTKLLLQQNL